ATKFRRILESRFDDMAFKKRRYKAVTIISVSHVFNFKNKGFLRSLTGTVIDLARFKFKRVGDRFKVLLGMKKDPYHVFDDLIYFVKKHRTRLVFMFQLSDYNSFDKNINYNRQNYRSIIKYVADYSQVGLRLGYFAVQEAGILKKEKK